MLLYLSSGLQLLTARPRADGAHWGCSSNAEPGAATPKHGSLVAGEGGRDPHFPPDRSLSCTGLRMNECV